MRDTEKGKGSYDCLPYDAIQRVAELYQRGAAKYNKHNWKKGLDPDRCFSSMLRHGFQALAIHNNEASEEVRAEDHLAAVVFNAFCLMFYEEQAKKKVPAEFDEWGMPIKKDLKAGQALGELLKTAGGNGGQVQILPKAEGVHATGQLAAKAFEQLINFKRPDGSPLREVPCPSPTKFQAAATQPVRKPLLYICGKMTGGGGPIDWDAIRVMNKVSAQLIERGFAVIMPQLTAHLEHPGSPASVVADRPISHGTWLTMDEEIIDRCDGLVRVINGNSPGADRELARARDKGKAVFFVRQGEDHYYLRSSEIFWALQRGIV